MFSFQRYLNLSAEAERILPGLTAEQIQNRYDAAGFETYKLEKKAHEQDLQAFLALARLGPGQNVLDLGFGLGHLIKAANEQVGNGKVYGVDSNPFARSEALTTLTSTGVPWEKRLLAGEVTDLSDQPDLELKPGFPGFDAIMYRKLLHEIPLSQQIQSLQHWTSFLAPGGIIIAEQQHPLGRIGGLLAVSHSGTVLRHRLAVEQVWKECSEYFWNQIDFAGLAVVSMAYWYYDGQDGSEGVLADAKAGWEDEGLAGEPDDEYVEALKKRGHEFMEAGLKAAGYVCSRDPVAVVAVLKIKTAAELGSMHMTIMS